MKYTVDYFIEKFEAIPEEKWLVGQQNDYNGNHCAYGWCSPVAGKVIKVGQWVSGSESEEGEALKNIVQQLYPLSHLHYTDNFVNPAQINNGNYAEYQQPAPKQRILAALYDIKKMQQVVDEPKTIAIVPDTSLPPFQSITFEKVIEQELASVN